MPKRGQNNNHKELARICHKINELLNAPRYIGHDVVDPIERAKALLCVGDVDVNERVTGLRDNQAEGETLLILACEAGSVELATLLLEYGADPNQLNEKGDKTPLIAAARLGNLAKVVRVLLDSGAEIEKTNVQKRTPLMAVIDHYQEDHGICQLLLNRGARANSTDHEGNTPLMLASRRNKTKYVRLLLDNFADPNLVNNEGHSALFEACSEDHHEIASMLLDVEAITLANNKGITPLMVACRGASEAMVQLLLSRQGGDVRAKNDKGKTALDLAYNDDNGIFVRLLLIYGADARSLSLLHACEQRSSGVIAALLAQDVVMDEVDDEGNTPLLAACGRGLFGIVKTLLEKGADPTQGDHAGNTPLLAACRGGFTRTVEALLDNGVEADHVALIEACRGGHFAVVDLLVNRGVNVEKGTVFEACEQGHRLIVEYLLANEAEIEWVDDEGNTSLLIACQAGHLAMAQFLIESGANVNNANLAGETALYHAYQAKHDNIVDLLLAQPDIIIDPRSYALFDRAPRKYGPWLTAYDKTYLKKLMKEIAKYHEGNYDRPFDFRNEDEVLIGYLMLRRLIGQHFHNLLIFDKGVRIGVELLLSSPRIKRLVVDNATHEPPPEQADYFIKEKNELLRLAYRRKNAALITRLLDIPCIREAAEREDINDDPGYGFYLEKLAEDRDLQLASLRAGRRSAVQGVIAQFNDAVIKQGGVLGVIEQLKQQLIERYIENEDGRCITFGGVQYFLPCHWGELQNFIADHEFDEAQQKAIHQIYYNNLNHTAYRYLIRPNPWMSETVDWLYANEAGNERWSTYEECLPLIAYTWLAVSKDLFIQKMGALNRLYNVAEDPKQLNGDKPGNDLDVKQSMIFLLKAHPLFKPFNRQDAEQFMILSIQQYYQPLLFSRDAEFLVDLKTFSDNNFPRDGKVSLTDNLNLPQGTADKVKEAIGIEYGDFNRELFRLVVDDFFRPGVYLGGNFQQFYRSAKLDGLLDRAISTYKLRKIVNVVAVNYLFGQADLHEDGAFKEFSDTVKEVQQHGVASIWNYIQMQVKAQYLALPEEDANEAHWAELVNDIKAMSLSIKAQEILSNELYRVVRMTEGYKSYCKVHRNAGGEGGSQSPYWSLPVRERPKAWSLMDCAMAAAAEHDEKSTSSRARKAEVAETVKGWLGLSEHELADVFCNEFEHGHGGWSKNSFKALLAWYVFNKYHYDGLKKAQFDLLDQGPINGEKIRSHCHSFFQGNAAIAQLCSALQAEFAPAVQERKRVELV